MYIQYVNIYCFYMTGPGLKREQVKFYFAFQIGLRLLINLFYGRKPSYSTYIYGYKNIIKKILKRGVLLNCYGLCGFSQLCIQNVDTRDEAIWH